MRLQDRKIIFYLFQVLKMKIKENANNKFLIRSPKLKGVIVEDILMLLYQKDYSVSDLLSEIKKKITVSIIL